MARTVAIGVQDFGDLIKGNCFYVDKTGFIREWWESKDSVTLITRPRRFGKTLNMSMLEHFFSNRYEGQGALFEGLSIWEEEKYRNLQGTYPVISLSFANVKETTFSDAYEMICQILYSIYVRNDFLLESNHLTSEQKAYYSHILDSLRERSSSVEVATSLQQLSALLECHYGKKVIILLDEYDTPMQEAYVNGYWEEAAAFTRSLFNATFKTNPYLERAIMTGITRVSKESIFSDLNNLKVVTTTSDEYTTSFGFTEEEVFAAMDEMGMTEKEKVKTWYDGFVFGNTSDIYNPWSILNYLDTGKISTYWANTSANSLVGKLIREGNRRIKESFETLMQGGTIVTEMDEQIVYNQLDDNEEAIWSLLLASGYLKVVKAGGYIPDGEECEEEDYELALTNLEVRLMFKNMIKGWFKKESACYNDFIKALMVGDLDAMNEYMNRVTASVFSSFDTGKQPSHTEPERFYHGFVLGLMVDLQKRYVITSNRESGFGRYDIMLQPKGEADDAVIIEFKVFNKKKEETLSDTLHAALAQIEEKQYEKVLIDQGIAPERIRKYGFAFQGKEVLIG